MVSARSCAYGLEKLYQCGKAHQIAIVWLIRCTFRGVWHLFTVFSRRDTVIKVDKTDVQVMMKVAAVIDNEQG